MLKRNPGAMGAPIRCMRVWACLFPCGADSRLRDLGTFWIFVNDLARQGDDNAAAAERWPSRDMVMGCMPCRPLQNRMPSGHDSFALFCMALSSPNSGRRIRISQRVPSISNLQPLAFRTPIKTPSQKAHRDRRLAKLTKLG